MSRRCCDALADTLEGLGDVDILDIAFTVTASWPEDEVSARVYYCADGECPASRCR